MIECVPNFSEGRKTETLTRIMDAITSAGASVLDRHTDADHNRSVITFVGEYEVMSEAVVRA